MFRDGYTGDSIALTAPQTIDAAIGRARITWVAGHSRNYSARIAERHTDRASPTSWLWVHS
jgi:hypothetical protein